MGFFEKEKRPWITFMAAGEETGGRNEGGRDVVSCLLLLVASNRRLGLGSKSYRTSRYIKTLSVVISRVSLAKIHTQGKRGL